MKKTEYDTLVNTISLLEIFINMPREGQLKTINGFKEQLGRVTCPTCRKKGVYFRWKRHTTNASTVIISGGLVSRTRNVALSAWAGDGKENERGFWGVSHKKNQRRTWHWC